MGSLTPEQQKALSVLEHHLKSFHETIGAPPEALEEICQTNAFLFSRAALGTINLPRGVNWLWNKSKATKFARTENYEVAFYKLNTRKARRTCEFEAPMYKLWIFEVKIADTGIEENDKIYGLWCERGDEEPASRIEIQVVNLEDLSFLSPYTTVESAKTFGWI